MKADTQISRSGVSYVPETDTCSIEVRGNLQPFSDTQELFLSLSRWPRTGAKEISYLRQRKTVLKGTNPEQATYKMG
jgi:hypothetical protein